jgi:hypothetical protein
MFYDANIVKDGEKGRTCSGRGEATDYTNFTKIKIRVLRVIRWPKTKKDCGVAVFHLPTPK